MGESMEDKGLFDLHFKYLEDLRNLYAKYEARANISINCLNFSVAIWAVTTTVLFNAHVLPFIQVLIYIILSVILVTIAIIGWLKGFSVIKFKRFKVFELKTNVDENFYEDNTKKLSENIQKLEKTLDLREQKVNYLSYLSKTALFISVFLILFVLVGKINEIYDCKIKPQNYIECNSAINNAEVIQMKKPVPAKMQFDSNEFKPTTEENQQ
jgi:hypothetical protein